MLTYSFNKSKRLFLKGALLTFFLSLGFYCKGQDTASQEPPLSKIHFSIGINFQRFAFKKNYRGIRRDVNLTGGKRNAQGIGLSTGVHFRFSRNLSVEYSPTWRYDVIKPRSAFGSSSRPPERDKYGFFSDHHFSLTTSFSLKSLKFIKQPITAGLGYSIISLGQSWDYHWHLTYVGPPYYREGEKVDFQFEGFHALLRSSIYRDLFFEIKMMYAPEGQLVYNAFQREYMIHLMLAYGFPTKRAKNSDL